MLKRLMNFLLFSTGITPKDHKERDKYAEMRARRAEWERMQQAKEDAARTRDTTGGDEWVDAASDVLGDGDGDGGGGGGDGD